MSFFSWLKPHKHQWVEIERGDRYFLGKRCGPYFIYQCTTCKKMKEVAA